MALGGHSWDRAGKIWYAALTDSRLESLVQFVDFAHLTVEHAQKLFSQDIVQGNSVVEHVTAAWKDVGVL